MRCTLRNQKKDLPACHTSARSPKATASLRSPQDAGIPSHQMSNGQFNWLNISRINTGCLEPLVVTYFPLDGLGSSNELLRLSIFPWDTRPQGRPPCPPPQYPSRPPRWSDCSPLRPALGQTQLDKTCEKWQIVSGRAVRSEGPLLHVQAGKKSESRDVLHRTTVGLHSPSKSGQSMIGRVEHVQRSCFQSNVLSKPFVHKKVHVRCSCPKVMSLRPKLMSLGNRS